MSDVIKCPVCGKVGVPDYHAKDVVCPQCGSDLSVFRLIEQIPQGGIKKSNVWMPIAAVAILTTVVLGCIMSFQNSKESVEESRLKDNVACLQDSIKTLNAQLETTMGALLDVQSQPVGFKYVVRKNDSFWSISQRFYNTGNRYEEIATANGLNINSILNVGDTLIIK